MWLYVIMFSDALDERITNTRHPIDLLFEEPLKLNTTNFTERELTMKYKSRVYGILHGGYKILQDTKPCYDELVDGQSINSRPIISKLVILSVLFFMKFLTTCCIPYYVFILLVIV